MDRRFGIVLGVSILLALVVSAMFYQVSARAARPAAKVPLRDVVAAAQAIPAGATLKASALKTIQVPAALFPKGGFSKIEEVAERPVASNILADEPILEGRLAAKGSGLGLGPIIPPGMRAASVRVNDVVGVAGYVLPGMRVDVLVTGRPPEYTGSITSTVLQNILVLSAGQNLQPDTHGQAINTPVVTLLVTPEQAEILTLASSEGRIQLVLRNSTDQIVAKTPGHDIGELYGGHARPAPKAMARAAAAPRRPAEMRPAPAAAAPAPAPVFDEVVIIRGNQKTVESVGVKR